MTTVEALERPGHRDCTRRIRRTLEGVLGVPATEGNRIEVLRNGDEIFPAMLDAIAGAEHTIDFLTFVYWAGDIGTDLRPSRWPSGPGPACGCASSSTPSAPGPSTGTSST